MKKKRTFTSENIASALISLRPNENFDILLESSNFHNKTKASSIWHEILRFLAPDLHDSRTIKEYSKRIYAQFHTDLARIRNLYTQSFGNGGNNDINAELNELVQSTDDENLAKESPDALNNSESSDDSDANFSKGYVLSDHNSDDGEIYESESDEETNACLKADESNIKVLLNNSHDGKCRIKYIQQ